MIGSTTTIGSNASLIEKRPSCFQFRVSFSPCTILQLTRYDLEALEQQIVTAIGQAPNFFMGSPVVIDIESLKNDSVLDFSQLKQILIKNGLVPIGIRGGNPEQLEAAATQGIPMVTVGKNSFVEPKKKVQEVVPTTKLVTYPIRSGMQVYAKDSDLIVIAQVSPGAELLADGNIHVYGTLHGRALAGVQGNTDARIFCQKLDAELISIAGYYLTKEDMQALKIQGETIQIYLEKDQVKVEALR